MYLSKNVLPTVAKQQKKPHQTLFICEVVLLYHFLNFFFLQRDLDTFHKLFLKMTGSCISRHFDLWEKQIKLQNLWIFSKLSNLFDIIQQFSFPIYMQGFDTKYYLSLTLALNPLFNSSICFQLFFFSTRSQNLLIFSNL